MSLWGKYDQKPQTNTATATVTVTAANTTVVGVNTKFSTDFAVGDYLAVGKNEYRITAVSNATVMTVESATGSEIKGAQSNGAYVVSEKPQFITHSMNINANTVYGVDTTEMAYANTGGTEADGVPHAGWVLRTAGTGGRAGRVHYEVLVAGSSITGDNVRDDSILPEEN